MPEIKSREDIENLQRQWYRDPTWDIEDTEGFEAHRKELLQFSDASKAHWAKLEKDKHDKQASLICLMSMSTTVYPFAKCKVEQCAAWDPDRYCCGMLPYKEVIVTGGINTHGY